MSKYLTNNADYDVSPTQLGKTIPARKSIEVTDDEAAFPFQQSLQGPPQARIPVVEQADMPRA